MSASKMDIILMGNMTVCCGDYIRKIFPKQNLQKKNKAYVDFRGNAWIDLKCLYR